LGVASAAPSAGALPLKRKRIHPYMFGILEIKAQRFEF